MAMENPQDVKGIIVLKGLPYTWKTHLAELIGNWASSPVLCIDDFLSYEKKKDEDEAERHLQHSFETLCRVAERHMTPFCASVLSSTIVIKSRLTSKFEVSKLINLTRTYRLRYRHNIPLLIIECQMRSDYRWSKRLHMFHDKVEDWYRPRSWNEIEKARDFYIDQSRDWEDHLHRVIESVENPPPVRWLVLDPVTDLSFATYKSVEELDADGFFDAVRYLLTPRNEALSSRNPYKVEYNELRRILLDMEISAFSSRQRFKYLCSKGDCLFKVWESLPEEEIEFCWVCEDRVSGPAYTCYYCILTLHKSCAERVEMKTTSSLYDNHSILYFFGLYTYEFPKSHPCRCCKQRGKNFSDSCGSCLFQTHLKLGLLPTIINHKSHQHFLSIQFLKHSFVCKVCWGACDDYSYGCKRCGVYYHLACACLPEELKHRHGGYVHTMKLVYSRVGMETEESYWCDFCYSVMDPQLWFYLCQECSYHNVHPFCAGGFSRTYKDMISS